MNYYNKHHINQMGGNDLLWVTWKIPLNSQKWLLAFIVTASFNSTRSAINPKLKIASENQQNFPTVTSDHFY
jgi:hypothetical protein